MDAAPEEGDEASDDETDAECADDPCPVEGHYVDFFSTFAKVGPFKAQFALYYLSKFAHSRRVRMVATAELDKRLVAGWGTGAALGKICPDLQKELPHCQKDDSAVNTRRCTLLTAILYYSAFGETAFWRMTQPLTESRPMTQPLTQSRPMRPLTQSRPMRPSLGALGRRMLLTH